MGGGSAVYSMCVEHTIFAHEKSFIFFSLMVSMSSRMLIKLPRACQQSHAFRCSTSATRHPPCTIRQKAPLPYPSPTDLTPSICFGYLPPLDAARYNVPVTLA